MTIRRSSEDDGEADNQTLADCLMLLSQVDKSDSSPDRVLFYCKTCNREFKSFQALGGHRTSHKKLKLSYLNEIRAAPKPKTRDCSICGLEFAIGQALGGHMRRHRDDANEKNSPPDDKDLAMVNYLLLLSRALSSPCRGFICNKCISQKPKTHDCSICGLMFAMGLALGGRHRDGAYKKYGWPEVPVTENGGLCFDLNLTPYENDLNLWSSSHKTAFAV